MLTTFIVGAVCFLLGAAAVFARFVQRLEQRRLGDPFETPPNPDVRHFVTVVQAHLSTWRRRGWQRAPENVQNVRQALTVLVKHSEGPAVWTVENGLVTTQDGTQLPLKLLIQTVDEALTAARTPVTSANLRDERPRAQTFVLNPQGK